jgi:large subunit ribosomal protein L9
MRQALEERRGEKVKAQADQAAAQLGGKTVQITARAGTGDRLYGSVTAQDIADAIRSKLGVAVDKRKVQLTDPIKAMGTYTLAVKLHRDVSVPVTVEVVRAAS